MSSSCSLRGVALGAGTPKVIVPLTATTLPALLTQADSVIAAAPDVVEWRFDFLENALQADELVAAGKALRSRLAETPLLATFRTADEGGEQVVAPETYAALYNEIMKQVRTLPRVTDTHPCHVCRDTHPLPRVS